MIDLDRIEAIARAATQGEWRTHPVDETTIVTDSHMVVADTEGDYSTEWERMANDAIHIATMSPATTLALVVALKEWRDAAIAFDNVVLRKPARFTDLEVMRLRYADATQALLTLISGKQETNNDQP